MNGKVKWFSRQKGYGFITGEDGKDYFAHYSGINSKGYRFLRQEADVTFDVETMDGGKEKAINIVTVK